MLNNPIKRMAVALLGAAALFFSSCQKELSGDGFIVTETPPDLTTKISSSVSGFVTDETNAAVNGATVQFGSNSTTTDKYGYFEFSNTDVVKNAAVVTVLKPGYFKGIKTYIASLGHSAFLRIKLIPKNTAGSFDAATGGTVSLANGLSITFPSNAVVVQSSGSAYTGTVSVAAQWINPVASDLHLTMPGDLRGLDSLGFIRQLATYGMAAVELTGGSGELLQIANGKKATITFPIPSNISGGAPASLPLWSFDETKGLWKQESYASKIGSNYIGEVSHFSYWNCDVPSNYVQFNCTIVDASGNPVTNTLVRVSVVSDPQRQGWGYTDSAGYTGGAVPNNANLLLEVFGSPGCNNAVYSQNFTTTNQNISLGTITIPSGVVANVSGSVINCSSAPVTNGRIIVIQDNYLSIYPLASDGTFDFTTTLCSSSTTASIVAEDLGAMQASNPVTQTLTAGNNQVTPALQACSVNIEQFINYSVDGTSYSLTYPTDSMIQTVSTQLPPPSIDIWGLRIGGGAMTTDVSFSFVQTGIALNSSQSLTNFYSRNINDSSTSILSSINVHITEYGPPVSGYISGNFSGTLTGASPNNTPYNITCSFRVRRRQ